MSKGFMRISKEIENWGWYRDSNTFRVFFHLMLKAQYQDGNEYMGVQLERGQVVIGRKKLSADLGISEQSIRTSLERLSKSQEITIKSTNRFSIITICKYDSWQGFDLLNNQQINQQLTNENTKNQPTTNHIQEIKNKENNNKEPANAGEKNEAAQIELFPEEHVNDESVSEKMKIATFNYKEFGVFFNNTIIAEGSMISKVRRIDERRKNTLHARMMEYGLNSIYEVTQKAVKSSFLNGGGKTGWKADFDWLFGPVNFRKVIEGKYDDVKSEPARQQVEEESDNRWQS